MEMHEYLDSRRRESLSYIESLSHVLEDKILDPDEFIERARPFSNVRDAIYQKAAEDSWVRKVCLKGVERHEIEAITDPKNGYFRYYREIYDLIEHGVEFVEIGMTDPGT
jgi:hypothetical protein